jgi:putative sterol carrier protein
MTFDPFTSLSSIAAELEHGWKLFDDIYSGFDARQWRKKMSRNWTFAEQPFHLGYFDAMVAQSVREGPDAPASRLTIRTMGGMNNWNRGEFAKRPASFTPDDNLGAMRRGRDDVRAALRGLTDADLGRKAWMPLIFGWADARSVLQACIVHNVAEYWKLWIRTGKKGPAPNPAAIFLRLDFMMNFMPATMNKALAKTTPFIVTWNFDGPGGGMWTFNVAEGTCAVTRGPAAKPNLVITMKPETFQKLVAKMTPPPLLILTGQMKIKGFGAMGTFGKLFPEPKPDQIIEPPAVAGAIG